MAKFRKEPIIASCISLFVITAIAASIFHLRHEIWPEPIPERKTKKCATFLTGEQELCLEDLVGLTREEAMSVVEKKGWRISDIDIKEFYEYYSRDCSLDMLARPLVLLEIDNNIVIRGQYYCLSSKYIYRKQL